MDVLYVKGMNTVDTEAETEEDIWDDRKLNDAYDKALRMANLDVAQRIAMATNSKSKTESKSVQSIRDKHVKHGKHTKQQKKSQSQKKTTQTQWKEGMPCRAIYYEDGFEYEGIVLSIIDDKECVVRFIGYNNTEIVPISSLQTTLGKEARKRQMEEAVMENECDELLTTLDAADVSDAGSDAADVIDAGSVAAANMTPRQKKLRIPKKASQSNPIGQWTLPDLTMPDITKMRQCPTDMPIPPPPMIGFGDRAQDDGLAAMLLSWYMSGYHTGYYQGLKRARSGNND